MRRTQLAAVAAAATIASLLPTTATGQGPGQTGSTAMTATVAAVKERQPSLSDNLSMPWRKRYQEIRQQGVEQRLRNAARGVASRGSVEKLGRGTYAKVGQTGKDRIFAVLVQFGGTRHSAYPDNEAVGAQRHAGPARDQIPKPNRKVDNFTLWKKKYNRAHYQDMYFSRMRTFYEKQSLGKYSFGGDVTKWVTVPFNEARYGRNECGDVVCPNTWFLVRDALAQWTKSKLNAGWSMARIRAYLKTFDHQDRYDFDGDGNFDEPDGYIDHFQLVHAGGDEANGDPLYGEDAIWSHRWNAQVEDFGTGPVGGAPIGGVNVGQGGASDGGAVQIPDNPTGVWVNDYTIQPENGGLNVFAHEFAHDLELPDLYDTSGPSDNSVEWWSLMAQSRGTKKSDKGVGDQAVPFGAWEKFQLGWLKYDVVRQGRSAAVRLQPNSGTEKKKNNGLVVLLPNRRIVTEIGEPCPGCGDRYYHSGSGNDLDNTMTAEVPLGSGPRQLTAKVRYEIEDGYDYAFLEASTDGGETWTSLETSESYEGDDLSGGANADGTGISGSTGGEWVDLTASVPAAANALRWRYLTDPAFVLAGFQVDSITLGATVIGDAETDEGWVFDGFRTTTGSEAGKYLNAYFVDNRQRVGYDKLLNHLYNFKNHVRRPWFVEFFKYNPGALITYWNTYYEDNDVGLHPGNGLILPVDANPDFVHYPDGSLASTRINAYDSTFSLRKSREQKLHRLGRTFRLEKHRGTAVFNDKQDWWFDFDEHGQFVHPGDIQPGWMSVAVPRFGTTIRVVKVKPDGTMVVRVG